MKFSDLGPEMTIDASGYAIPRTLQTEILVGRVAPDQGKTPKGTVLLVTQYDGIGGAFTLSLFPTKEVAEKPKVQKPELHPVSLVTRPCARCGELFELGRTDFFRLEYMDHGIWTTLFLCRLRCLREVASAKDSPLKSRDRLSAAPNRETR